MGFGNAKKILKQMNRLDVPVYIGESTPLRRDYVNALDTHGEDGLGESFLPEVTGYQQQISAVDFLADVLKKEKVSIIELAPMTNLARLIQKDKEAFSCIEEIVSMGGSFKSHEKINRKEGKRGIFISRADHCNSYHGSAGGSTGTAVPVLYT